VSAGDVDAMTGQGGDRERSDSRPRAREDVVFRTLAREWVIYDPHTDRLHVLNATAALVWSCCDGEHTAEEIAAEVRESLEEAPAAERLLDDVLAVIAEFSCEGLLE
jgi:Coenzyme PQQ synthesis protein D (PqqD)